jgi:hypothetical protein
MRCYAACCLETEDSSYLSFFRGHDELRSIYA